MADLTNAFRELARLSKNAALRSEVPTMWWGAVVSVGTDTVSVVLEQDDSVVVREVTVNAAGPCLVGDEVLLMKQGADLTIVVNQTAQTRALTDTGWVTSGVVTSLTGVTVTSQYWRRLGMTVYLDLDLRATVATTVPASGDIGNTIYRVQVGTAWAPTTSGPAQALPGGQAGRAITGYIASGGLISISAVAGTTNIAVGDTLRLGGSYLLG
ncbi:hypothetical protein [Tessaracoccus palaemonis]|uniref:Minor tail protein n=1 Tax=Tessaracoccus palaemonis TaxID=2829499 RepID=A0ABX8SJZ9_9ACTN|nr:hypothetical protein [Tessaracoccus palaemonis]QXT62762.1 hypothetical protein KDB89_13665 [Tessaracoccus palaemonis]